MAIAITINIRTRTININISLDSILWGTIITCSLKSYNSKFEIRYFVFVIRHSFTIFIHIVVSSISLVLDSDIADIFLCIIPLPFPTVVQLYSCVQEVKTREEPCYTKICFSFQMLFVCFL